MIRDQFGLDTNQGNIVDNFAGGGDASTGIEMALGRCVDVAINHDAEAIQMLSMNHPQTRHYCESVWDVEPLDVTQGRPVGLGWFSPDCKHFSKAKSGKPREKHIRGLAWIVLRWVESIIVRSSIKLTATPSLTEPTFAAGTTGVLAWTELSSHSGNRSARLAQ